MWEGPLCPDGRRSGLAIKHPGPWIRNQISSLGAAFLPFVRRRHEFFLHGILLNVERDIGELPRSLDQRSIHLARPCGVSLGVRRSPHQCGSCKHAWISAAPKVREVQWERASDRASLQMPGGRCACFAPQRQTPRRWLGATPKSAPIFSGEAIWSQRKSMAHPSAGEDADSWNGGLTCCHQSGHKGPPRCLALNHWAEMADQFLQAPSDLA